MDELAGLSSTQSVNNYHVTTSNKKVKNFHQLLNDKQTEQLKISKHAEQRLESRNLHLDSGDYRELSAAMDDLAIKGSRESLLIYKDMGLIANIHNRTIITAMDMNDLTTVTNIDSTKFIK